MGDLGFWALAQENPDDLALVTPDGDEVSAGELLGRANQVVHALRAQGFGNGDVVATLLPNGAEMIEVYLAALQAGWYLVPINHHLVAPEIAYILKDSGAKVFVAHERFAEVATAAADEAGIDGLGPARRRRRPGLPPYAAFRDAQPTTLPEDRTVGDVMNYTSGTTGNPKGIYRPLMGVTPEQAALGLAGLLFLFSDPAAGRQRPHHRLAAVPHGRAALRQRVAAPRPHRRAHGQVDARGDAAAHRRAPGDDVAHGARRSSTACWPCPRTCGPSTTCRRCAT